MVNPSLYVALHMHSGGRRVDPSSSHESQRGKRPKEHHPDDQPTKRGSEEVLPTPSPGMYVLHRGHVSELNAWAC
jgi:hypothetical protein